MPQDHCALQALFTQTEQDNLGRRWTRSMILLLEETIGLQIKDALLQPTRVANSSGCTSVVHEATVLGEVVIVMVVSPSEPQLSEKCQRREKLLAVPEERDIPDLEKTLLCELLADHYLLADGERGKTDLIQKEIAAAAVPIRRMPFATRQEVAWEPEERMESSALELTLIDPSGEINFHT